MAMEFSIRVMRDADLPAVAEIEAGVFTDWYRVHRRDPEPLAERTIEELRYATSISPDGNLVAISAEGSIVGFVMSRVWGNVGWFGTFGVPTQFHGQGIGKALVACVMDHLRGRSSFIGLETMPESGANIGLYTKSGLVAGHPTVMLEYPLLREAERIGQARAEDVCAWSSQGPLARRRLAAGVREIGDAILPGLDHTVEVKAMDAHGLGETFFSLDGGDVDGYAIFRTKPFRVSDTSGRAYIHALAVRPGADPWPVVLLLLRQMLRTAVGSGITRAVTGVSTRYPSALELLFAHGFRGLRAAIRMVDKNSPPVIFETSGAVELSRWAG